MGDREHYVISISRLSGSGGSEIGRMVASRLRIDYYDRKLLTMASDDSGINEELFAAADEKLKNSLFYKVSRSVYKGELIPPESSDFTSNRNLFNYQAKVLKELAKQEDYVVIGRCADFVLKDMPNLIKIFVTSPEKECAERTSSMNGISLKDAQAYNAKINRQRSEYYRYFTGQTWSHVGNYDLCINSSCLSYEEITDIITDFLKRRLEFNGNK
jgi:cytidylate kinase